MVITILIFILILGLLIFSHEFGHFIAARRAGIKVEEFGFGLPPRIFGIKKGETIYSLNLLPIGGFVKIFGEEGEDSRNPRSFASKTIFQRFNILIAGVSMNVALAVILLSFGHAAGLPEVISDGDSRIVRDQKIQIMDIAKGSPAESAGLMAGDSIKKLKIKNEKLKITGIEITDTEQLQGIVAQYKGEEIILILQRGSDVLEKSLVPREVYPENEGPMGVGLVKTGLVSYPWYIAPIKGIENTAKLIIAILLGFFMVIKNLIIGAPMSLEVAGPIGIVALTSQVTKMGFIYILQFTAFLSVNLAIINALPFPALDGGRVLFLAIEKIKGSPVNRNVEKLINNAGFAALIALMIFITFRDIGRLF